MDKQVILELKSQFENASQKTGNIIFWSAREVQSILDYKEWRNFEEIIEKSKIACMNAKQLVDNHFVEVNKMVDLGSGSKRTIKDYLLTRFACYLIAQNGDPRKQVIAFAQSYFAIQTRKQELIEERLQLVERVHARTKLTETEKALSNTLYQHGVDDKGFAEIRSSGDMALFGNYSTSEMKKRLGINPRRALADFLPTVTLKAKEFAAAITDFNVNKHSLSGKYSITEEHVKNNLDVRGVLKKSDILPENLPAEEDIKKIESKIKNEDNKALNDEREPELLLFDQNPE